MNKPTIVCPKCNKTVSDYGRLEGIVSNYGMCIDCFEESKGLTKLDDGSYVPWNYLNTVFDDKIVEHSLPNGEENEESSLPKVSFSEKYDKWELKYIGVDSETNDCAAMSLVRYYDTKEELSKAIGL